MHGHKKILPKLTSPTPHCIYSKYWGEILSLQTVKTPLEAVWSGSTMLARYIEDIWLFQCKIDFYFTEWTTKAVFSRVKIPLLVFMSEKKNNLSLKKSNFLFLFCLKISKTFSLFQCISLQDGNTTFSLAILRQIWCFQHIYWVCFWLETQFATEI